jgi:hypothetical protein
MVPRAEGEVQPLAGLEQQVVEPVEGDLARFGRGHEALTGRAARLPPVVADDDDRALLGGADPLARGLRDAVERRLLGFARRQRQRDPVP